MLLDLLTDYQPDAVVHFAEQRAAPYSMKSSWHKRYTVNNNVNATHNLLAALVEAELDTHVVHLGTMGVYGYGTAGDQDPRGLPPGQDRHRRGHRGRAGDPVPGQPGQRLPHDQDPGSAAVRVLQQERRHPGHRPAPGDRVGHADRRDAAGRAADQPLRLRRRLRHRAQPLPDAGRDRLPADRPRHRRPDARVHPHPGHRALHPAGDREPAGAAASASGSSTR